ncbi:hypothetical protein [uncultured Anaerococcus sp.]|uniref:hypothetical protein n=1 Tax=uncultured Anaerococcus sp. TaxID=293428 RepID=UPI00288AD7E3|nr:hypothetical protein [uncultured Anaerococcus sp.]
MKKSKLLLALAISAMLINTAYASEEIEDTNDEKMMEESQMAVAKISANYIVKKIEGQGVLVAKKSNPNDLYNVAKKEFKGIDLKVGMEVRIVSDDVVLNTYPAQFAKIYEIKAVQKENNKEEKKEAQKKVVRDFVVKEIYEEGVDLYEVGNESNLYNVPKSEFKGMKIEKGKVFTITSDNISLKSYPAQFGKIFSIVEKKEMKKPTKTMVKSYVVEKVTKDIVTVHEKDMKESKYNIAKKNFGKANPQVGETYKIETSEEILTSDPAQFAAVYKVDLEKGAPKENQKPAENKKGKQNPAEKEKKPEKEKSKEKPAEKEAEKTISDIFVVEKIDEEGVTVYRKSNKEDKYLVPKKDFGKLEIKEGKEYKIFSNDVALTSYPAQFGKIYKIEEVMAGKNKESAPNPKTGLISAGLALVGLIGAGLGYKKIK